MTPQPGMPPPPNQAQPQTAPQQMQVPMTPQPKQPRPNQAQPQTAPQQMQVPMTPQPKQPRPKQPRPEPQAAQHQPPRPTRVVIAEDSAILRDGLVHLLTDRGFEVTASVPDAEQLREAVSADPPDVCVVDIRMPPTFTDEGLRAAIELRRSHPQVGILVFSQYVETRYATELLAESAHGVGYLLKDRVADVRDFVEALRRVASGGSALDPEVVAQFFAASRRRDTLRTLTPREHEVLTAMAEGLSNSGIAAELVITERAVEKHVANILAKFDLPPSDTENRRVMAVLRYLES